MDSGDILDQLDRGELDVEGALQRLAGAPAGAGSAPAADAVNSTRSVRSLRAAPPIEVVKRSPRGRVVLADVTLTAARPSAPARPARIRLAPLAAVPDLVPDRTPAAGVSVASVPSR